MKQLNQGVKYNLLLKPSSLKGWYFIRETKRCLVLSKTPEGKSLNYTPKKNVFEVQEVK